MARAISKRAVAANCWTQSKRVCQVKTESKPVYQPPDLGGAGTYLAAIAANTVSSLRCMAMLFVSSKRWESGGRCTMARHVSEAFWVRRLLGSEDLLLLCAPTYSACHFRVVDE